MADNYVNDTNDDDDDDDGYRGNKTSYASRLETDNDDADDLNHREDDEDLEDLNEVEESNRDDDDDMEVTEEGNNIDEDEDIDDDETPNIDGNINETSTKGGPQVKMDGRRKGAVGGPRKGGFRGSRGGRRSAGGATVTSRTPSVRGLTIPFRTIKKSMKLDPDIPIVQNEAAIMATVAVELFLKRLVTQSHRNAKSRGRNTVRYEDVAEARTKDKSLAFLETLLP